MRKFILYLFLIFSGMPGLTSELEVVSFDALERILNKRNDTTYLVNFWATWCKPCVDEIPAIEKLNAEYAGDKLSIILVSLDFPRQIDSRVKPFIRKHEIDSRVLLLDEKNPNRWIDKVDKSWSGAIPASVIYNRNFRQFYEQSFEYEELKEIMNAKISKP